MTDVALFRVHALRSVPFEELQSTSQSPAKSWLTRSLTIQYINRLLRSFRQDLIYNAITTR